MTIDQRVGATARNVDRYMIAVTKASGYRDDVLVDRRSSGERWSEGVCI
jgi:hypothetical protein